MTSSASMASMAPWLHVELRIVHQGSRMFSITIDNLSHFANVRNFAANDILNLLFVCCSKLPFIIGVLTHSISRYHKISRSNLFNFDKLGLGQDIEGGETIDWATAEAMSFASLLLEGNHVRITGALVTKGYVKLAATSVTHDCH